MSDLDGGDKEVLPSASAIGIEVESLVNRVLRRGDSPLEPIQLEDDDDSNSVSNNNEERNQWEEDEEAYDKAIARIEAIDLTQDADDPEIKKKLCRAGVTVADLRCAHYKKGLRNPCLCRNFTQLEEYRYEDNSEDNVGQQVVLKEGQVVALSEDVRVGRYPIDFIEITQIHQHRIKNAFVLLRGTPYTRTRNMDGRLAPYKSEVCRVIEVETDDHRPVVEQSAVEVSLDMIEPSPRVLHKTNKPFPECRFDPAVFHTEEEREHLAPLTCRWEQRMLYPDRRYRRHQRPVDGESLRHLMEHDVPRQRHRASDAKRLVAWRGVPTRRGGSYVSGFDDKRMDLECLHERDDSGRYFRIQGQKYNAADMFSGAGGFTTGAKRAGFRVERAVDHWPRANATYRLNHPEVSLIEDDIMRYCNDLTLEPHNPVDVVHLSPPCQTWSPAHTCSGRNDEANVQALYACVHIVRAHRPRIITFEQTFGLVQERHLPFFNALLQSLAGLGYSFTWKVFRLVEFGLPQTRKRLIMIGAAPGERLPDPWPAPTHSEDPAADAAASASAVGAGGSEQRPRTKKFVSAIRACAGLVPGEGLHDVENAKCLDSPPWDGHRPMNRTVTTSGGQAYHWGGQRGLTLAEFHRLQGFPPEYVFVKPCVKKQIGNAFPPVVVERIMGHVRRCLEDADHIASDEMWDLVPIDDDSRDEDLHDVDDDVVIIIEGNRASLALPANGSNPPERDLIARFGVMDQAPSEEAFRTTMERGRGLQREATQRATSPDAVLFGGSAQAQTGQVAMQGRMNSRGSGQQYDSRRRSSSGSSLIITGSRGVTIVIKDDEEEGAAAEDELQQPTLADKGHGAVQPSEYVCDDIYSAPSPLPSPPPSSPGGDNNGNDMDNTIAPRQLTPLPATEKSINPFSRPREPTTGRSHAALVPSLSDWMRQSPSARCHSATGATATTASASTPTGGGGPASRMDNYLPANMLVDEVEKAAREASMREAKRSSLEEARRRTIRPTHIRDGIPTYAPAAASAVASVFAAAPGAAGSSTSGARAGRHSGPARVFITGAHAGSVTRLQRLRTREDEALRLATEAIIQGATEARIQDAIASEARARRSRQVAEEKLVAAGFSVILGDRGGGPACFGDGEEKLSSSDEETHEGKGEGEAPAEGKAKTVDKRTLAETEADDDGDAPPSKRVRAASMMNLGAR